MKEFILRWFIAIIAVIPLSIMKPDYKILSKEAIISYLFIVASLLLTEHLLGKKES